MVVMNSSYAEGTGQSGAFAPRILGGCAAQLVEDDRPDRLTEGAAAVCGLCSVLAAV